MIERLLLSLFVNIIVAGLLYLGDYLQRYRERKIDDEPTND